MKIRVMVQALKIQKTSSSGAPYDHRNTFKTIEGVSHLLVDLDGTLVGAKDLSVTLEFLKRTLPEMKKQGSWLNTLRAIRSMREVLETPNREFTNNTRATRAYAETMGISMEKADAVLTEMLSQHFPKLEKHFYPIPGAKDFLKWAKDRYPLILATNPVWKEEIVRLRIQWAQLDPTIFRSITHSEKMHACKPSSEYYLEILEQEKLTHSECMLIGNDPKKDLPAVLVGIPVFIITRSKSIEPLKLKGQKAPAWSGAFKHLRQLLQ